MTDNSANRAEGYTFAGPTHAYPELWTMLSLIAPDSMPETEKIAEWAKTFAASPATSAPQFPSKYEGRRWLSLYAQLVAAGRSPEDAGEQV